MYGYGGSWRVLMRLTDEINSNSGNTRNRILYVKHYGYRNYNYLYFAFADKRSTNHYYQTPYYYFTYYKWYYLAINVGYSAGKYDTYLYEPTLNLKWSNSKTVTANQATGFNEGTTYFMIGGDNFYEKFYGYLKDIKFYSTRLINSKE